MRKFAVCLLCAVGLLPFTCTAQQAPPDPPDAPKPSQSVYKSAIPRYSPPTQSEGFKTYLRHTYGISSIVEAGVRGGIDQALDRPSEWPEGGQGYADRFGSAIGEIAIRGTTEYLIADIFKKDLRHPAARLVPILHSNALSKTLSQLERETMDIEPFRWPVSLDQFQAVQWPSTHGIRPNPDDQKLLESWPGTMVLCSAAISSVNFSLTD